MNNESTEFYIDCSSSKKTCVPDEFKELCEDAVLVIKDMNTLCLLSPEEFEKVVVNIAENGDSFIKRTLYCMTELVDSFKDLQKILPKYAERLWNKKCTLFRLTFKDGIYQISEK